MESKKTSNLKHVVLVTLSAAIGGFLFGFDSSVINGANFVVSWSFPVLTGKSGIGVGPTYVLYTLFATISIFFVAKFITETKGKTLESM